MLSYDSDVTAVPYQATQGLFVIEQFKFFEAIQKHTRNWGSSEDWAQFAALIRLDDAEKQQVVETICNDPKHLARQPHHWLLTDSGWAHIYHNTKGNIVITTGAMPDLNTTFALWLPMPLVTH